MDLHLNPNNQLDIETVFKNMIEKIGTVVEVPKNTIIIKEGETCDFFFFVIMGIFRAYRWVDDNEVTIGFSFTGDIDTCPYSFVNDCKSKDVIHSLTSAKIIKVKKTDFLKYVEKNKENVNLTDFFLSSYIEVLIHRLISIRLYTAEKNYLNLLARNTFEVNKIPISYIASYLGVSLERISRIRKKNILN